VIGEVAGVEHQRQPIQHRQNDLSASQRW
jgi:hypothetical protein